MRALTIPAAVLAAATTVAQPALAQDNHRTFVINNDAVGVPVFPNDISDRPYRVLGQVKAGVRKATVFSGEPSQAKIYRELWERADKLGADAVINARYGDVHVMALSWGKNRSYRNGDQVSEPGNRDQSYIG